MDYIAIIHKENDSDYGVSFPNFPGCVTGGRTLEEAKDLAADALQFHVKGMREDGDAIPHPSDLDTIMQDADFQDGVAFLVTLKESDRTVRVNITLSENDLNVIDTAAANQGMKRSAYLVKAGLAVAK